MANHYKVYLRVNFILLLVFLSLFLLCRGDNPSEKKDNNTSRESNTLKETIKIENYDSLLTNLVILENAVSEHPDSIDLIGQLLKTSSLVKMGYLYVAGIGVASDESTDPEIRKIEKLQASRQSSKEWALYIKAHLRDTKLTSRTKIMGKVMYSTSILEIERNDTVFQLFKMPVSSVVIY